MTWEKGNIKNISLVAFVMYFTSFIILVFQILSYLQEGKRLDQPKSCPNWLYELMRGCWAQDPRDRRDCEDAVLYINGQVRAKKLPNF